MKAGAAVAAVTLAVAACGRGDRAGEGAAQPIRIIAADYAYSNVPDTVQTGWHDVRIVNRGRHPHMAVIARLDSGTTLNDVMASARGNKVRLVLTEVGGVNNVMAGDSLETAIDLPVGRYLVGCFIIDSAGRPHIADGMAASFVVADAGAPAAAEPAADDTVRLTSFQISFANAPVAGRHRIRVENSDTARVNHDLLLLRIDDGKTAQDAMAWFATENDVAPFTVAAATTGLPPGLHDDIQADLVPGRYVALCVMSAPDGRRHFAHGMMTEFTVKD